VGRVFLLLTFLVIHSWAQSLWATERRPGRLTPLAQAYSAEPTLAQAASAEPTCVRRILNQGGSRFIVLGQTQSIATYDELLKKGLLNSEVDFLPISQNDADAAEIDLAELQHAREIAHDYVFGALYDLVLSSVARAVGVSAALKDPALGSYSAKHAAAFFLAFQKVRRFADPLQEQEATMAQQLFMPFVPFGALAHVALNCQSVVEADRTYQKHLDESLRQLLPYLDERLLEQPLIDYFFIDQPGHQLAERNWDIPTQTASYFWTQCIDINGSPCTNPEITYLKQLNAGASREIPHLLLSVYELSGLHRARLLKLAAAEYYQGHRTLGFALALNRTVGEQLHAQLERVHELVKPGPPTLRIAMSQPGTTSANPESR
jgi:hypothetical protein